MQIETTNDYHLLGCYVLIVLYLANVGYMPPPYTNKMWAHLIEYTNLYMVAPGLVCGYRGSIVAWIKLLCSICALSSPRDLNGYLHMSRASYVYKKNHDRCNLAALIVENAFDCKDLAKSCQILQR